MHGFTHLLSRTRSKLVAWHRSGVSDIENNLINTEINISDLELSDLNDISQSRLLDQYSKLSAIQRQCSIKWAQRAKILWVNDGDRNTRFFHSVFRTRSHNNYISQIQDLNGNTFCVPADIESAFIDFFHHIWNAPSNVASNIADFLPPDLPRISDQDRNSLIVEVTKEEVFCTLSDLPSGKSPGPDGFNVEFYQNY